MTHIKTAEERMKESGKYGDPLEIVSFHKQEIAELRAALEQAQERIATLTKALLKAGIDTAELMESIVSRSLSELEAQTPAELSSNPLQLPAQPIEPAYSDIKLTEQIMSDCGIATEYRQSLVERIAGRIAKHIAAQPEQEPVGEVQHWAAPANMPAYVNMKWYGNPPKNGTKLYTKPEKEPVAWMPIETAPKDFVTVFDGWNGERVANVFWGHPDYEKKGFYDWVTSKYVEGYGYENMRVENLTHWMPLPPPPATQGEGK